MITIICVIRKMADKGEKVYKKHFVTSGTFDVDLVTFGIVIFEVCGRMMARVVMNYQYAPGLISKLNILHEGGRLRSKAIPKFARDIGFHGMKLHYDFRHESNHVLRTKLGELRRKYVDFLLSLTEGDKEEVVAGYAKTTKDEEYMRNLIDYLGRIEEQVPNMFVIDKDRYYDHNDDIDIAHKRYTAAVRDQLIPSADKCTKITMLGSKTQSYQNETQTLEEFFGHMENKSHMNHPDADFYYLSNSIVHLKCTIMLHTGHISFRPVCSSMEYFYNRASTRTVIRKHKIEQPLVVTKMSV